MLSGKIHFERRRPQNFTEIDLWEREGDWEDEDGCYNSTMFNFTLQNKWYLKVVTFTFWISGSLEGKHFFLHHSF